MGLLIVCKIGRDTLKGVWVDRSGGKIISQQIDIAVRVRVLKCPGTHPTILLYAGNRSCF